MPELPVVQPRGVVSIASRADRGGDWELPARFRVFSVAGDVRLDLCQARFHPGTSEIHVVAIVGQVRITVPHGVRVELVGGGFGDFRVKRVSNATARPDAPCVRVTGSTFLGSVIVRVVDPSGKR